MDSDSRQELYETAKETLLNIACVLHRSGILVDVDNFHENLSQVDVFSDNDTEDEPPKMGFLSALPRNDGITTDTINAVYCLHGGERELGVKRSSSGKDSTAVDAQFYSGYKLTVIKMMKWPHQQERDKRKIRLKLHRTQKRNLPLIPTRET